MSGPGAKDMYLVPFGKPGTSLRVEDPAAGEFVLEDHARELEVVVQRGGRRLRVVRGARVEERLVVRRWRSCGPSFDVRSAGRNRSERSHAGRISATSHGDCDASYSVKWKSVCARIDSRTSA